MPARCTATVRATEWANGFGEGAGIVFRRSGGVADVDLYSRPCGGHTLVAAFLYEYEWWKESDLIQTMLDSFRCGAAGEIGNQVLDRRAYAASPDIALFAAVVRAIMPLTEPNRLSVDPRPLAPDDNPAVENARIFADASPHVLAGRTAVLRRLHVERGAAHTPPRCAGPRHPEADGNRPSTCPPEDGPYITAVLGLPRTLPDDGTGAERGVVRVVERRYAPDGASTLTTWDYQMRREARSTEWKLVNKVQVRAIR